MAGRYKADRNADGTWNVRGVPVFASNRLRKVEVTKDWQERAVRKAAARYEANGYVPPLHENHHGDGSQVRRLGSWLPKRVVKVKAVEMDDAGEPVVRESWATEADLLSIPEVEYQRIKRGDLPYVSVEANLAGEDLESLAMLPTQAPAIKLPPVTIGAEQYAASVVTYAATPAGARSTMRFSATMDESTKKPDDDKDAAPKAGAVPPADAPAAPDAPKPDDAKPMDDKPQGADGEIPAGTPPPKPVPAQVTEEAVPGYFAKFMGRFDALMELIAKGLNPSKDQPVPMSAGGAPAPYAAPVTATFGSQMGTAPVGGSTPTTAVMPPTEVATQAPAPSVDAFAAINGRMAALEGWKAGREAEDALRAKVKPLVARCLARVPTIDADQLYSDAATHGLPYVEAFTAAVEKYGVVAPPPNFAAATSTTPNVPPEVLAYQDKSPEVFAAARHASDAFDATPPTHRGPVSRERWIALELTRNHVDTK